MGRIAIITDDPGWHGARLREAFAESGFSSDYVSLTQCRLVIESGSLPIRMPGFEPALPDGVFVRGVPGGSLEQVVHYLDVLHALKRLGIVVYNDAQAIERSVDKAMTSFLLQQAGIPTPATWVTPINSEALGIARRELAAGHRLVSKPVFGSQGQGVQKLDSTNDLGRLASSGGIFYLQRFVENDHAASSDWRVFVINGKAKSAMRRYGKSWLNNVARGARCEIAVLDTGLGRLAEDAVAALDMNYGGIDIMRDSQDRYRVIEVNSIPAWKGLESVSKSNIARMLADDFLSLCSASRKLHAAAL
ncbi:MAG: RimK family alpha-L-glutamate ligase [Methylococcaceae bacterium]|nr:RimK family alpha-L-glutamate ligase [Methylococcaceae bacterium]